MKLKILMTSAATAALVATGALAQDTAVQPDTAIDNPVAVAPLYTSIAEMTVDDVIGTIVYTPEGERIGEIDYVLDAGGDVSGVIGIGGFIGLGEYTVAIPMSEFDLTDDGMGFVLAADVETLKSMPEFDESGAESLPGDRLMAELMPASEADSETMTAVEAPEPTVSEEVAEGAENTMETVEEGVADAGEAVDTTLENAGDTVAGVTEEAGEMAETAGEAVAETVDDGVTAVEEAGEEVAETVNDGVTAVEETGEEMAQSAEEGMTAVEETGEEMAEGVDTAIDDATEEVAETPGVEAPEGQAVVSAELEQMTVGDVVGMVAYDLDGNSVGEIDYVIMPASGPEAVIGIGGFLGLGEYTVALPIEEFTLNAEGDAFTIAMSKEALKQQPEFDETGVAGLPDETPMSDVLSMDVSKVVPTASDTSEINQ